MSQGIEKLKKIMVNANTDAVLISSVSNIIYLTGYSGFSNTEREAYLLITKTQQYIITDGRYSEAVLLHIPHFELIERTIKNTLDDIFKKLIKKHHIKKLGLEEDNLSVSEFKQIKKHYNNTYHYSLTAMRSVKDNDEIARIEKACDLGDKTFDYILKKIKKGVSEKEIAFEIEFFIKKNGADLSFPTIVAFGKNSAIPHHQSGNDILNNNQFVLLDFGVKLNNYCSDMTRTIFFGKPTEKQKKIYQVVLESQKRAIDFLNTKYKILNTKTKSLKASDVDNAARDYIIEQNYPTIPHSLGHGIGIEVHEFPNISPNSKDILKEGMVFSIEPGIYIPGFGGVRIEDLVVLEKQDPRLLTKSRKTLIELT